MILRKAVFSTTLQMGINLVQLLFGLMLAFYYGASAEMDAYVAAATFVISLNTLLVGSQGTTLIPFFSKYHDHPQRNAIINSIVRANVLGALLLSAALFIGAGPLILLIAPGLTPAQSHMAANCLRILSVFLLFSDIGAIAAALLDYQFRFELKFGALLAKAVAGTLVLFATAVPLGMYAPALANTISMGVLAIISIWLVRGHGIGIRSELPFVNDSIREYAKLLAPILLSFSFVWIITYTDTFIASFLDKGSLSRLNYSQTIRNYLATTLGILPGIYFPLLSRIDAGRTEEFLETFLRGLRSVSALSLASVFLVVIFSPDIIALLFMRGEFSRNDTDAVAALLRWSFAMMYCAPVGSFLAATYYARHETRLPTMYSIASSLVNIVVKAAIVVPMGVNGIALAGSIGFLSGNILQLSNIRRICPKFSIRAALLQLIPTTLLICTAALVTAAALGIFSKTYPAAAPWLRGSMLVILATTYGLLIAGTGVVLRIDPFPEIAKTLRARIMHEHRP